MKSVAEHVLEAGAAMPPPRQLGLPRRTNVLLVMAVLILCLFLAGGGRALAQTAILPGAAVIGVTLWLLVRLALWYRSRLRLLQRGIATVGTILHKRAESANSQRYYLRYGYAYAKEREEHEEEVSAEEWKKFEVGQSVTVLYDLAHPKLAGLYVLIAGK